MDNITAVWCDFEVFHFIQGGNCHDRMAEFMDKNTPPVHCPEKIGMTEGYFANIPAYKIYHDTLEKQ